MRQRLLPILLACGLAASIPGLGAEAKRAAPLLYVTNQGGANVSVIDTATDAQVATLIVAPGPAMIVASPDRNSLYITHPRAGKISILDAHALVAPKLVDISGSPSASPSRRTGGCSSPTRTATFSSCSTARPAPSSPRSRSGQAPAAVVVSPHSRRAFVANSEDDSLSVVDTDRLIVIATVGTGRAPSALALSDQGDRLYVANAESGELAVLSAESLAPLGSAKVGMLPHGVAVVSGGDRVLVANRQSGSVSVVDAASLVVTYRARVGGNPESIAVLPDGSKAYVVGGASGDIAVLNGETGQELKRLRPGDGPRGLVIVTPS